MSDKNKALREKLKMRKYNRICEDFRKMSSVKAHGVSKYSTEYIITHLSEEKYFLLPDTLLLIIRNEPSAGYQEVADVNQTSLF